jgi:alpha-galactosidase
MEYDGKRTNGFGVKTGCRAMAGWQVGNGALRLLLDVRSGGMGVRLGPRTLEAAEIVTRKGRDGETSFQATKAFCHCMCDRPRLPRQPMVGTLDWYYTYGKCTERLFVTEAELFAKLVEGCNVRAFALVDAGWALGDRGCWHEDQTTSHPEFGSIHAVARNVRAMGLVPGIWTRVLCANPRDSETVRLPRDHKFLDPSLPVNLERTRDLMRLFRSWGFDVIKHDFSTFDIMGRWGWQMKGMTLTDEGWTFRDNSLTTPEVILGLYRAIREGCGTDAAIIGCNTVSHLSAGMVEYCRVGDDSGGNLEKALKCGCNPFAFRLPQNGAFYITDPDCIGNLKEIPWEYYSQFIRLASKSGALLQVSTRLGGLTSEQRSALREGFKRIGTGAPKVVEPLDWMEKTLPAKWRIGNETVDMDWNLTPARENQGGPI